MDKKSLLQKFNEDDRVDVLNLFEKYNLALDKDIPLFGVGFYTPNIWKTIEGTFATKYFKIKSYGFFEEAERRMISFNNMYDISFPIKIIKVQITSKFNTPSHGDFLGAVMGLGVKRSKIGDLLVQGNTCYFPVCEEIHEFIVSNLTSIGRAPCKVMVLEEDIKLPDIELKEEVINVQSLRIDSIVAKLTKTSRAKSQEYIESGKVLIDYNMVRDKSKEVVKDDRITIRGIGKFILGEIIGSTKSGKFKVIIKKYT